jgi:hypothetical protein
MSYILERRGSIFVFTTGLTTAKAIKHSAKLLLSATLGISHTVKFWSAKKTLPSVLSRALGKAFVEC